MNLNSKINLVRGASMAVSFLPFTASALALNQVLGFFNIVVGLFLTAAIVSFGAGLTLYWTRYGTWPREDAFPFMTFGITILFVLSVLLAIIHFLVQNTSTALYIIAVVIFICLAGIILFLMKAGGGDKKDDKGGH